VNRKDWGLNWNTLLESGGVLVGEEVGIECEIQLIKEKDGAEVMQAQEKADESITAEE
jgi:hypothetical protein